MTAKKISSYKNLKIWQRSITLSKQVYKQISNFPKNEIYGLSSQIKRSTISIPSNIAEGHARSGTGEYKYHLSVALGSIAELETQLILAVELEFLKKENITSLQNELDEIGKMIRSILKTLAPRS